MLMSLPYFVKIAASHSAYCSCVSSLLSSINCRSADSSIMYRMTTDNTGTKGSGEICYVVFHGISLRFIRVFRQSAIFGYQQLPLLRCWMDGQFPRQVARRE